ncbi:MAG: hypothetical protein QM763_11880 [Agriterribacter sp.]
MFLLLIIFKELLSGGEGREKKEYSGKRRKVEGMDIAAITFHPLLYTSFPQIWHIRCPHSLPTFSVSRSISVKTEIFSGIDALAYYSFTFVRLKDFKNQVFNQQKNHFYV